MNTHITESNTAAVEAYFEQHPLSTKEREAGSCLRVVKCTRASRYTMAWFYVYATKGSIDNKEKLRPCGLKGAFIKNEKIYSSDVLKYTDDRGARWNVKEFEIVVPYLFPAFSVEFSGAKKKTTRSERKKMQEAYWHSIAHATRCKGYSEWAKKNREARLALIEDNLTTAPLMSIVTPVYKTPPKFLEELIQSVHNQTYSNWEHILVNASPDDASVNEILSSIDDKRVRIVVTDNKWGIVGNTNAGIEAAQGDYISFLDHDDLIEKDALYWMVKAIENADGEVDLINCDEDSVDERGVVQTPRLKPPLNPDLLYANNYVLHLLTVSRRIIEKTARSDESVNGAQDYDVTLKAIEKARKSVRIPEILYHWRSHRGSTNSNPDSKTYSDIAGQKSLEDHFVRLGTNTKVHRRKQLFTYQSEFLLPDNSWPSITCIIEGHEAPPALKGAIDEYRQAAPGVSPEVDVVYCAGVSVQEKNRAIQNAQSSLILFVSDNIGELSPRFLQILAGYFERAEVGIVAPKVIRSDDLIDYAGIAVRPNGELMRLNRFMFEGARTFLDRPTHPYDSLVVNAEYCMMRTRDTGDFMLDQSYVTRDFALADICMQYHESKKLCVYTPFAQVQQLEYKTALTFCDASKAEQDRALLLARYGAAIKKGDPTHNPNFDPYSPYYRLKEYETASSDGLHGHLWYLAKRAGYIFKSNGVKNVAKTIKRYLLKRQS